MAITLASSSERSTLGKCGSMSIDLRSHVCTLYPPSGLVPGESIEAVRTRTRKVRRSPSGSDRQGMIVKMAGFALGATKAAAERDASDLEVHGPELYLRYA